jgi:VWFA-related protein
MRFVWLFAAVLAASAQETSDFSVSVELVPITCSITDKHGQPIPDMRMDEFVVTDNGKPQPVRYLWREADAALTVGLVVDISGSQARFVEEHRQTMARFLETVLRPQDRAFLTGVSGWVKLVTDTTSSLKDLRSGVENLDPRKQVFLKDLGEPCTATRTVKARNGQTRQVRFCGGTLLWDGVYSSARLKMKPETGRKALLALTDGMDNGIKEHTLNDAIEAAQSADASVYSIRYRTPLPARAGVVIKLVDKSVQGKAAGALRRLSEETGGRYFDAAEKTPQEIFAEIEQDLRTQYVLAFAPATARDGKFHKVEIKSKRSGVVIRAREGYTARKD